VVFCRHPESHRHPGDRRKRLPIETCEKCGMQRLPGGEWDLTEVVAALRREALKRRQAA